VVERELRALDVQLTNLHQLQDAILSIWANISKECFQYLLNQCHEELISEGERVWSMVFLIIL